MKWQMCTSVDEYQTEPSLSRGSGSLPRVSVVILTYQNFDGLWKTLETVALQNYENIEVLISDDNSASFPLRELEQWQQGYPKLRIRLRRSVTNSGTVRHANMAVASCNGEYIKFLPPGDGFQSEHALETMVKKAQATHARILTSPALVYVDDYHNVKYAFPSSHRTKILKQLPPERLFSVLARSNIISAVGTLFHRSFFEMGGFNEAYRYLDDWPTWLSALRQGEQIEVLEVPTVYYGLDGISNRGGTAFNSELLREDLIRCYEQEIFPYKSQLSAFTRWFAGYRYGELTGGDLATNRLKYLPIKLYCQVKSYIKRLVISK